jgi:hypothetical protein
MIEINGVEFETTGEVKHAKDEHAKEYVEAVKSSKKLTKCKKCLAYHNRGKDHVCDTFMLMLANKRRREKIKNPSLVL